MCPTAPPPPGPEHGVDGVVARADGDADALTHDDRRAPLTADDRATLRLARQKRLHLLPGDGFDR
jgi:hypothetical protein